MAMTVVWVFMIVLSILFGAATGQTDAVNTAMMEGAGAAVELCLSIGGLICLWSGIMEVMNRTGLSAGLSRLLRPILGRLFPSARNDTQTMNALSSNVSANMLGLGNAATPMGIRAASGLLKTSGGNIATNELCRLVVLNTASIQLLPTTVAGIRAATGAAIPFDILPAVWITSVVSVFAGLLACRFMEGFTA